MRYEKATKIHADTAMKAKEWYFFYRSIKEPVTLKVPRLHAYAGVVRCCGRQEASKDPEAGAGVCRHTRWSCDTHTHTLNAGPW